MNSPKPPARAKVAELKNVTLRRQDRLLLDNIDWTVYRGEHWAVLGRNGAGKTLMLKILAGYLWPTSGRVDVLTERFGEVDLRELRQDIGWVSAALAERIPDWDSVRNVVLSGPYATFGLYEDPPNELKEKAAELMEDLGLTDLADQEFGNLSAGEKQRVLLARARLPEPRLLILDEPCAALDLSAREKFLALVEKTAGSPDGPTMLMVTHRVDEITPGFSHAIMLLHGRCLAAGPIREVLTDELFSQAMEIESFLARENGRWHVSTA